MKHKTRIAILGGGPSGLFMYKRFVDSGRTDLILDIFERKTQLGSGMPYSGEGANDEHITNVSGNEIPELVTSVAEWVHTVPVDILNRFRIDPDHFNDYKVMPRLLFGMYLSAQFNLLQQQAEKVGIQTNIYLNSPVTDIIDYAEQNRVSVEVNGQKPDESGDHEERAYDHVVICTGHNWPFKHEGIIPGYYDSPYPPAKLAQKLNHPIAIKGSSLTAIDAIRTLARSNGNFNTDNAGKVTYKLTDDSADFRLVMHSRNGMLPAIRFHLEDPHLLKDSLLGREEIEANRAEHEGFLSLDFVFERNFKDLFRDKEPGFYEQIKDMDLETFVDAMMELRERVEPFQLFKAEYAEAEKSIKRKESVYWKEMLAVLSFAMNYPAKYLCAEDMQRLQKVLMPLISIVIAFIPQSSVQEMLALYDAGILDIVPVGDDSDAEPKTEGGVVYHYIDESGKKQSPYFKTFVDCVGQPHLSFEELPYKSLLSRKTVSPARLKFKIAKAGIEAKENGNKNVESDDKGNYYLRVPGITINDNFQAVDEYNALNERVYIMAVPYIGGYNPDYSGLDFCEAASAAIVKSILNYEHITTIPN
ncbi:FAD/NAD(P)-binding protein [Pedobacter metabolipauper]|uniref:FAD-NAD(P)-binding protein n=1 Tax=Pedobacter metabolipauper TaxID=425513 RepID=A0A4R6SV29_9SPHI|nr:FAD/NAD(P)-binding protein [Pedobacter metabolipauper]TDQ09221.1 FAD-NAD(P)-binding protein [Pedobacter metabolipauper]